MKKVKSIDLLSSPIVSSLLTFALPILISNALQQFYNAADTTIVGNFLGFNSLAAIGATSAIYELIVGFAIGIANGMGIVVARHFGAGDIEKIKRAVAGSIVIGSILSLVIMFVGGVWLYGLLRLVHIPENIIDEAYSYIYIIMIFFFLTFFYNWSASMLRAIGNSLTPLLILLVTSVINIGLDILFITRFNSGIKGAAIATVISQAISALLCIVYMYIKADILIPKLKHFKYNYYVYADLSTQGFAMGFMSSIVSIGTVILQTAVNGMGVTIIAAQTTGRRIMFFLMMPMSSLATALTTFVSQNFGAGNKSRIKSAVKYANIINTIWSIISVVFVYTLSIPLIRFISGSYDKELIANAKLYIDMAAPFFWALGILFNLRNALQGMDRKIEPLISSCIELICKIAFVLFVIPRVAYMGVVLTEPIIWVVMVLQLAYSFYMMK
jgi:MATE efflux family protein